MPTTLTRSAALVLAQAVAVGAGFAGAHVLSSSSGERTLSKGAVAKIARAQTRRLAPTLSVASAKSAQTAQTAQTAQQAATATHAGDSDRVGGTSVKAITANVPAGSSRRVTSQNGVTLDAACDGAGHLTISIGATGTGSGSNEVVLSYINGATPGGGGGSGGNGGSVSTTFNSFVASGVATVHLNDGRNSTVTFGSDNSTSGCFVSGQISQG